MKKLSPPSAARSRGSSASSSIVQSSSSYVSSAASYLGSPHEYVDYAATKGAIDTLQVSKGWGA